MENDKGLFVRGSTGLVREAGFVDAVSVNVANMSVGAALGTVGFTLAALPTVSGVNLIAASLIAFTLSIPQIITYTTLTRHIPRTGGDYVWLTRAFGPKLAWLVFGLALGFVIESLVYYSLIAIAGVDQLSLVLPLLGINVSINPMESIILSIVLFAIIVAVNIMGTKYGIRLMTGLTVFSILSLVLSFLVLFLTPRAKIIEAVSGLLPNGYTYSKVASQYTGPYFALGPTIMMLPFFAIYIYPWLNAGPAMSSEIKGRRAVGLNVPTAALLTMLLATIGFTAMYYALGFNFVTAALSNSNINGTVNYWTIAMAASGNPILAWIIGIGSVTWNLAILAYGAIIVVRYWFAMSFDRVLPSFFAYLSPRFGSPVYAHLFDLAITSILITLAGVFYGTFTALYGAVVEALLYYMAVGIAAVVIGIKGAGIIGLRNPSRVTLAISGMLFAAVMGFLTYQFLEYPSIWGGNWLAYGVEAAAVIIGIALYVTVRLLHKRRLGIDIAATYMEIPPE
ncbi:MAG: APC family permease [Caldivirga sp.]|uniref:APC family permease n=2 Tax=Caldivirga sp. TaxID=2080243 RepID=UPI003D134B55